MHAFTTEKKGTLDSISNDFEDSFKSPDTGENTFVDVAVVNDGGFRWLVVLSVPQKDFLGEMERAKKKVIGAVVGARVSLAIVAAMISYLLVRPIKRLSAAMLKAANFDFSDIRQGQSLRKPSIFEPAEIYMCKAVFRRMLVKFADAIERNRALLGRGRTFSIESTWTIDIRMYMYKINTTLS